MQQMAAPSVTRDERRRAWKSGWPIGLCTAGLGFMFAFGFQGLIWAVPGVVLSWRILTRPTSRIRVPRS